VRGVLILLSCAAALAPVAAARAAGGLTEAPFAPAGGTGAATCMRATGFAGEFATSEPAGRAGRVRLWSAAPGGPVAGQVLRIPSELGCAAVAADAEGGALLAALSTAGADSARLLVATRAPGGRFGRLRAVDRTFRRLAGFTVAVGASGDGLITVVQPLGALGGTASRLRALRITAAGKVSRPETVATVHGSPDSLLTAAGVDGAGRATIAWSSAGAIRTRSAAANRRFARAQTVPGLGTDLDSLAMAVAPDGRALLAADGYDDARVAERAPGAARFAPGRRVAGASGDLALALGDDGAAVLAAHDAGDPQAALYLSTRPPGGVFASARALASPLANGSYGSSELSFVLFGGVGDVVPATPRVVLDSDGRFAVSWLRGRTGAPESPMTPWLARGSVSGSVTAKRFGSPARGADGTAPVLTADGRAGLAWADGAERAWLLGAVGDQLPGRVHLALEGAPGAPSPPPPSLRLRVRRRAVLYAADPLPVTAICGAPCDVRVAGAAVAAGRTAGPGATRLHLGPSPFRSLGTRAGRRVVVRAVATAPGGVRASRTSAIVVIRRRPAPVPPRVVHLDAHRHAGRIVVTWGTDRPARRVSFNALAALDGHAPPHHIAGTARGARGGGRTRHRVVMRPNVETTARGLRRARWVYLMVVPRDTDARAVDPAPVRIR
jgi:hypothetical protein